MWRFYPHKSDLFAYSSGALQHGSLTRITPQTLALPNATWSWINKALSGLLTGRNQYWKTPHNARPAGGGLLGGGGSGVLGAAEADFTNIIHQLMHIKGHVLSSS